MNRALATVAFVTLSACVGQPQSDATLGAAQSLDVPNPGIAAIDSRPLGQSYGQWAERYWQWALAQPADKSPLVDTTGANCGQGQSGDMFFLGGELGGGTVHRACTVPFGKSIFVPVISLFEMEGFKDRHPITSLRQALAAQLDAATVFASIDGQDVIRPDTYRAQSPAFGALMPSPAASNVLGVDKDECRLRPDGQFLCGPLVDDSFALILSPLTPGPHLIHVGGTTTSGVVFDVSYALQVPAPLI